MHTTTRHCESLTTAASPAATARRRRGPRGWLLVEVAIGGVMASVILGGLLIQAGASMDQTTTVSRQITAAQLAQQGVEQARSLGMAMPTGSSDIGVPANLTGTYTRTRSVTAGTETVGTLTLQYRDISVTVTFPSGSQTKTVTLSTRVYAP